MKISKKLSYGMKILLDLIEYNGENEYVSIKTLADKNSFSENYLEKIISCLKQGDLVISNRGVLGGYKISRPICTITLYDIFSALEKDSLHTKCTSSCTDHNNCKIIKAIGKVDKSVIESLKNITLREIVSL